MQQANTVQVGRLKICKILNSMPVGKSYDFTVPYTPAGSATPTA